VLDLRADPIALTAALVDIPSESRYEQRIADEIEAALRAQAPGFEVVRTGDGSYLIRGEKPYRWVNQTDFTNDEAVGYLADRLARLGVEEALAKAGAEAGDTVLIGDFDDAVVFDWDPELQAGGGHAAGPRGSDWRLER